MLDWYFIENNCYTTLIGYQINANMLQYCQCYYKGLFMIFEIKSPLLGFENITKMELTKIDDVFARLQVTDAPEPSFTLINPFVLREYDFEIPTAIQTLMEIDEKSNLLIYNMLIINTPIEESFVNFVGPLVFNLDNNTMAQVILADNSPYAVAEKLSNFLNKDQ